jgi:gallate dioxygenase
MSPSTQDLATLLGPAATIRGQLPVTTAQAQRAYRLTAFLGSLRQPGRMQAFVNDMEAEMARAELSQAERDMLRQRDFIAMLRYGTATVAVAKACHAMKVNLVELGALQRGQSAAEFITERRRANEGQPWQF